MCSCKYRLIFLPALMLLIPSSGLRAQFPPRNRPNRFAQPGVIVIQPQNRDPFGNLATAPKSADEWPVSIVPPPPPLPTREPIPAYRLQKLIGDLQSDEYRKRLRATRELKAGGAETVAALRKVAENASPEVYRRAATVLEAIFLCDDSDANRAAEDALESLRTAGSVSLALHIEDVFEDNQTVRSQRALADIQDLGGQVEYSPYFADPDPITNQLRPSISHIRIPLSWSGGDEGLKYVARLSRLPQLYIIKSPDGRTAVTQSGIQKLMAKMPNLQVYLRGSAQIGLRFTNAQTIKGGLQLEDVPTDLAAGRAGLKPGDILQKLDGRKIETFEDLTTALQNYSPKQKVAVEILRPAGFDKFKTLTVEVQLGGWDD